MFIWFRSFRFLTVFVLSGLGAMAHAQNHIWESNGNTTWTRNQNWEHGSPRYGNTGGRLDFRGNATANYNPLGQGFGNSVSTFTADRGLLIGNTTNGSLAISSGEIRLQNSVLSINNAPVMANYGNANLSISGTGRLDASGNVNDFIFYWEGTTANTSTLTVDGSNAQFIGNAFNLRRASGGTGTVNIRNGGTLAVSQIMLTGGTGGNVLNFNGGILRARASNANFFGTSNAGLANTTVNLQASGLTVDTNGYEIGIGQSLGAGGGGLTKTGAGDLTLSGSHSYTGSTNIQDGIFILAGSHWGGNHYTIAASAELGGSGETSSNVIVNGQVFAGGKGDQIGALYVGGMQLAANSTTRLQLDSTSLEADTIGVSGNGLHISTGANLTLDDLGNSPVAPGTRLTLVAYNQGWNGGLWSLGNNLLANNSEIVIGLNRWLFRYDDSGAGHNYVRGNFSGFVTVQAVPEPNALLLMGIVLSSGFSFTLRRRRRKLA